MISWRAKRQLVAILVLFFLVVIVFAVNYRRFVPISTCFDNKQNQGEIGIDCGGPCASCELKNPKPISVFWTRAVPVRDNVYDVAAYIENPNIQIGSADIEYEFSVFDEVGLVARRTGTTFILPQEKTHIVEAGLETSRQPTRVEFKISGIKWQIPQNNKPSLIVEKRDYKIMNENGTNQSILDATIFNNSPHSLREAEVNFIILDKDSNLLGANHTLVNDFSAGSRRAVRTTWPNVLKGDAAVIEIDPRIDIFNPDYVLKPR